MVSYCKLLINNTPRTTGKYRETLKLWGSYSAVAEDSGLVGCTALSLDECFPNLKKTYCFGNIRKHSPNNTVSYPRRPESLYRNLFKRSIFYVGAFL